MEGKGSPRELLGVGWVEIFTKSSFVLQYQNLRVDFDIAIQKSTRRFWWLASVAPAPAFPSQL